MNNVKLKGFLACFWCNNCYYFHAHEHNALPIASTMSWCVGIDLHKNWSINIHKSTSILAKSPDFMTLQAMRFLKRQSDHPLQIVHSTCTSIIYKLLFYVFCKLLSLSCWTCMESCFSFFSSVPCCLSLRLNNPSQCTPSSVECSCMHDLSLPCAQYDFDVLLNISVCCVIIMV